MEKALTENMGIKPMGNLTMKTTQEAEWKFVILPILRLFALSFGGIMTGFILICTINADPFLSVMWGLAAGISLWFFIFLKSHGERIHKEKTRK